MALPVGAILLTHLASYSINKKYFTETENGADQSILKTREINFKGWRGSLKYNSSHTLFNKTIEYEDEIVYTASHLELNQALKIMVKRVIKDEDDKESDKFKITLLGTTQVESQTLTFERRLKSFNNQIFINIEAIDCDGYALYVGAPLKKERTNEIVKAISFFDNTLENLNLECNSKE